MRNFKKFILSEQIEHQDDQYEVLIANSICQLLLKSINDFFSNGKQQKISDLIIANSKGYASKKNLGSMSQPEHAVVIHIPPVIKGIQLPKHFIDLDLEIRIKPTKSSPTASYGHGIMNIELNTDVLAKSNSINDPEMSSMLVKLNYQIHHESTHISSGQANDLAKRGNNHYTDKSRPEGSEEYNNGKVAYYTDPGELRAHAKQFAVIYSRYFPKQQFDMNKMMSLSSVDSKIERFFKGFDENGVSNIWRMNTTPYQTQFSNAKRNFVPLVKYFVDYLNKS